MLTTWRMEDVAAGGSWGGAGVARRCALEPSQGCAARVGVAGRGGPGRRRPSGVWWGRGVLTRPDLAVPAGVLVLGLVAWRRWAVVAVVGAAVALPWHLFAW